VLWKYEVDCPRLQRTDSAPVDPSGGDHTNKPAEGAAPDDDAALADPPDDDDGRATTRTAARRTCLRS
jgi:hypothetical protein